MFFEWWLVEVLRARSPSTKQKGQESLRDASVRPASSEANRCANISLYVNTWRISPRRPKIGAPKKISPFTALSGFKSSSFNGGAAFSNAPHHSPLFHLGAMVPAWWVFVLAGALAAIFPISPCDVLPLLPRRPTCSRPSSGPSPVGSPPLTGVGHASPRTGRAGAPQQEQRRCWWGASSIS